MTRVGGGEEGVLVVPDISVQTIEVEGLFCVFRIVFI